MFCVCSLQHSCLYNSVLSSDPLVQYPRRILSVFVWLKIFIRTGRWSYWYSNICDMLSLILCSCILCFIYEDTTYLKFHISVKLNANRIVVGTLRGFDQFMNLVIDNTVEVNGNEKNDIGMVVSSSCNDDSCLIVNPILFQIYWRCKLFVGYSRK